MPLATYFFPKKKTNENYCISEFEENIKKQGLKLLGWRNVPVNRSIPGRIAMETEPFVKQVFIAKKNPEQDDFQFNLKLFIARKVTEHAIIKFQIIGK